MYLPSYSVIMSRLFIWQNHTIKPTAKGFIRQNPPYNSFSQAIMYENKSGF